MHNRGLRPTKVLVRFFKTPNTSLDYNQKKGSKKRLTPLIIY